MTETMLQRRYRPVGNTFFDLDMPCREQYLFKLAAVMGTGSYRRAHSASGCQQGATSTQRYLQSNIPNATKLMDAFEVKSVPSSQQNGATLSSSSISNKSLETTLVNSTEKHSDESSNSRISSSGAPTTVASKALVAKKHSTDVGSFPQQVGRTAVECFEETGRYAQARARRISQQAMTKRGCKVPESYQLPLNTMRLESQELDSMPAGHGCTGANSTSHVNPSPSFDVSQAIVQANVEEQHGCKVQPQRQRQPLLVSELLRGLQSDVERRHCNHQPDAPRFNVPQKEQPDTSSGPVGHANFITTLMIQPLPTEIRTRDILEELDTSGFKDLYDFCYVPCDFSSNTGLGFAFVNFVSQSAAAMLMAEWNKTCRFGENCTLFIYPAEVQGYEANAQKWTEFRLKRIRNPSFRPFVAQKCKQLPHAVTEGMPAGISNSFSVSDDALANSPTASEVPHESEVPVSIRWLRTGFRPFAGAS